MKEQIIEIEINSLNERGYGVGTYNNKEAWILNSLPGEKVNAKIFKSKKGIYYGIALDILNKSKGRLEPKEEHFLSCSPWQIIDIESELKYKNDLIRGFYKEFSNIDLPEFEIAFTGSEYNYRNKFEFSFYGHEDGKITFAYHKREGSKAKYAFNECVLAPEAINRSNNKILEYLNTKGIEARSLKGLLNRYSYSENKVVSALYIKNEELNFTQGEIDNLIDNDLKGLLVIYSNPKSPAFVETKILLQSGEIDVFENILDKTFTYPYDGFFQVNPPVFELAAKDVIDFIKQSSSFPLLAAQGGDRLLTITDLYAGVGTIGLLISEYAKEVKSVELFEKSREYAERNKELNNIKNLSLIQDKAESSHLDILKETDILIVDPPRTGLHDKLIKQIIETKPIYIIYLSCNPKTQAQNFNILKDYYSIKFFKGYNFYPHTPHVESLMIMEYNSKVS